MSKIIALSSPFCSARLRKNLNCLILIALLLSALIHSTAFAQRVPLTIKKDDSIVFLGNTFVERMQLFCYFESFLHCRFPKDRLRVRYMGWSADEVQLMVRPRGFPQLRTELHEQKADVIFICFGLNESYRGSKYVKAYQEDLTHFVESLLEEEFNGKTQPQIALVSPIAFEQKKFLSISDAVRNHELELYSRAMAQVAKDLNVSYVDLFTPTLKRTEESHGEELTINGIHLTEYGDQIVSQMMAQSLVLTSDSKSSQGSTDFSAEKLRRLIYEKNYHFFMWWHPPNASYIHGGRNNTEGAKHLVSERQQQLRLIDNLDQEIWDSKKASPSEVWKIKPKAGRPVWFPTPADRQIEGVKEEARLTIEEDGDSNQHIRSPEDALSFFELPEGYQVNLFASEADFPIANPSSIQFDARGRLWVANTPTWPHPLPGKQPNDSIAILEDTDNDGVADKHTVFLDKLNLLHGFGLIGNDAYVAQAPYLLLARDTDDDAVADWIRVVLHGFGAEDAEHAMNNFRYGPDGALYFTQGIFYHTQVETAQGPVRVKDSAVFRYRPYDQQFNVYVSHSFWNPFGNLFSRWGRGIMLDASAGQYYPMDVLSTNYIYPKEKERTDHLSFAPGGSIAAGCEFIASQHFPSEVQGRFLVNHCEGDVGTHWYALKPKGSIYQAERIEPSLLKSSDKTFRPVAMAFGPDGALYVVDFYSHIFENVNFSKRHPGRDHSHGRIWRITHNERPLQVPPKIVDQSVPMLLDLLTAFENTTRELARRELQKRGHEAVLPHLDDWVGKLDHDDDNFEHHLTEALWVKQSLNAIDEALLKQLLKANHPEARMAATQVLREWQTQIDDSIKLLHKLVNDKDARVRLHAILACGYSKSEEAIPTVLEAANHEMDPGLEHALSETLDYLEQIERQRSAQ